MARAVAEVPLFGPGGQLFRPLAVHYRPLPVTTGRSSPGPPDQPVTPAYRPVGVHRPAVSGPSR